MRYLILRCHPRDTLPLSINSPFPLLCPTTLVEVRKGPSRTRARVPVPILPSFLFYPVLNFEHGMQLSLPRLSPKLHVMMRPPPQSPSSSNPQLPPCIPHIPPSSYAFCTARDIQVMTEHFPTLLSPLDKELHCGAHVEITDGLLAGTTGIIQQIKNNGDITLKIQQHLGWQFSTCIVNASVLRCL